MATALTAVACIAVVTVRVVLTFAGVVIGIAALAIGRITLVGGTGIVVLAGHLGGWVVHAFFIGALFSTITHIVVGAVAVLGALGR